MAGWNPKPVWMLWSIKKISWNLSELNHGFSVLKHVAWSWHRLRWPSMYLGHNTDWDDPACTLIITQTEMTQHVAWSWQRLRWPSMSLGHDTDWDDLACRLVMTHTEMTQHPNTLPWCTDIHINTFSSLPFLPTKFCILYGYCLIIY
jgi:hypothetical protein